MTGPSIIFSTRLDKVENVIVDKVVNEAVEQGLDIQAPEGSSMDVNSLNFPTRSQQEVSFDMDL